MGRIHWKDIGDAESIRSWAQTLGANLVELKLESQFRCNGSDGYLAWVDNTLQVRSTANTSLDGIPYEFKVCDTAAELRDLVYACNEESNKARMVAGYCWDWVTKERKEGQAFDIEFKDQGFAAKWNLKDDGMLWILKPDSVREIGCIHTCQGLEVDYIGVIIGPDLVVRDGNVRTDATKRSSQDRSMHGYKQLLKTDPEAARAKADAIIKNTYRTLMTRGQKGCFVYAVDPETNEFLKAASAGAQEPQLLPVEEEAPFRVLLPEEAQPFVNCVPKFHLEIAAGNFGNPQWIEDTAVQWVELPEHLAVKPGYFVAKVVGESMNQRIPNGSWCLFRANPVGSRNGKIVLVGHRELQDPDGGGQFTVKRYHSEKRQTEDGWQHERILLRPESHHPGYEDIILGPESEGEVWVVGEWISNL
jgi:DUF2075 family protein